MKLLCFKVLDLFRVCTFVELPRVFYHLYIIILGGSLADIIEENKRTKHVINETDLKSIMYQMAQGIKYIHSQNLVHLDIKPGM